jgi:hypothetical protein
MQLSGAAIDDGQLAAFLKDVKTLEIGSAGPDQIVDTIGSPHVREKEGGRERWKYSFILGMEHDPSTGRVEVDGAYQVDAVLELGLNGALSIVKVERFRSGETEVLYRQGGESVSPGGDGNVKVIADPPDDPQPGTIYLNTSDGHFYGWNGAEWRRLDN